MTRKHKIQLTDAELRLLIAGLHTAIDSGPADESRSALREWKRLGELLEWLKGLQEEQNKPWGTQA